MAWVGLLTATNPCTDAPDRARSWLRVAGETLLERNLQIMQQAGAGRILLYVGTTTPQDDVKLAQFRQSYPKLDICFNGPELAASLDGQERVVLIEEGVLLDPAILNLVLAGDAPHALAVWPAQGVYGAAGVRLDAHFSFASVVRTHAETVRQVSRGLGDWDLTQTLVRTALGSGSAQLIDLSTAPAQSKDDLDLKTQSKDAILWLPLYARSDEAAASARLIVYCQQEERGATWPERFIYPPLLRLLSPVLAIKSLARPWLLAVLLGAFGASTLLGAFMGWKYPALLFLLCLPFLVRAARLSLLLYNALPGQAARYQAWFERAVLLLWFGCFAVGSPTLLRPSSLLLILCPLASCWLLEPVWARISTKAHTAHPAHPRLQKTMAALSPTLTTLPFTMLPLALAGLWPWAIWLLIVHCLVSWGLLAYQLRTYLSAKAQGSTTDMA